MQYVIPRDIKVKEVMAYGLNGKQMLYLLCGIGGAVGIATLAHGLPIQYPIASSIICFGSSLIVSTSKVHGQDVDKYIANSVKYPIRQKQFGGNANAIQKEPTVNLRYILD